MIKLLKEERENAHQNRKGKKQGRNKTNARASKGRKALIKRKLRPAISASSRTITITLIRSNIMVMLHVIKRGDSS